MWEEIFSQIIALNKHELSLNGEKLIQLLESNHGKVDAGLFKLKQLNFVQLSNSHLDLLKDTASWDQLPNLQQLHLYGNKLTSLPGIENLSHLKVLDVSHNLLGAVQFDFTKCTHLASVNFTGNQITSCSIKSTSIHTLNLSLNSLESFPEIPSCITDLNLSKNKLKVIPETINHQLPNLKILDMSENEIVLVPKSLASIKLKTLNLKQNPLKDKKLHKFIEQNQALKAITEHIQKLGISTPVAASSDEKSNDNAQSKSKASQIEIKKFDESFKIDYDMNVKEVRGFILCCIVNNLNLNATSFKEFLQFQTKLHDTICKKRELATIATHDLGLISSKILRYAAKHKDDIQIQPLKASKAVSGSNYFATLEKEAENIRKEKKRNQVTGIYKFLDLLKGKDQFAFLETADTKVCLSLPPLTNSDVTKLSTDTKQMLIEVTSHFNAAICNQVMLEMIKRLHQMMNSELEIQQVRITSAIDGSTKTLYPSKVDLKELESDEIEIIRP